MEFILLDGVLYEESTEPSLPGETICKEADWLDAPYFSDTEEAVRWLAENKIEGTVR